MRCCVNSDTRSMKSMPCASKRSSDAGMHSMTQCGSIATNARQMAKMRRDVAGVSATTRRSGGAERKYLKLRARALWGTKMPNFKWAKPILVALMFSGVICTSGGKALPDDDKDKQQLKDQLRVMQQQMQDMQKQIEALSKKLA